MRLSRILITNHSRLQDVTLDVRDHLVLVGPNDAGKSGLLRCLDLLLGASTAALYNRITSEDFRDASQPFTVEATLASLSDIEKAAFPDEASVDPSDGSVTLTVALTATVDVNSTLAVDRRAPRSGTHRQLSREQVLALGWTLREAGGPARDVRDDRRSPMAALLRGVDLGDERDVFDAVVQQLQGRVDDSAALERLRDGLARQLSRALPVEVAKDQLGLITGAVATGEILGDLRLLVDLAGEGNAKEIGEQSDGMRALYAVALYDLLSTGANIVAIDEPEIHLHPTSQRGVGTLLRTGANQKILATHSPDIVSAFAPDSIVSIRSGGRAVQPASDFLTEDEKLFVHWWVRDKLEPLTASHVLAVEGVCDRIFVQAVGELTGRNLDRLGVSVVETDGAGSMNAIVKLFGENGFDVPMTLLIDEDARQKFADWLGVPPEELEDHGTFVSNPDLEGEYIAALGAERVWEALSASPLFTPNQLRLCARGGSTGEPTAADLRTFFVDHRSFKVPAAIAVVQHLDAESAGRITGINAALAQIAGA